MTTTHDVISPIDGSVITTVSLADETAVDEAVERARAAHPAWRALPPSERAALLRRFADLVEQDIDHLADLEVANAGHTIGNARWEAGNVANVLRYYSAAPERLAGRQIPVAGGINITFKEPIGVVGVIAPWNFPMPIAVWGFAPALAAGNCVVLKPAELTPLTAMRLAELATQSGLPDGVFQVLVGSGRVAGERIVTHPGVGKVVFTGSTTIGTHVMASAAAQVKSVTLELGGKNANIVFADSDLPAAAASAPGAAFDNAGQDCCSRSRVLVQRSVFDQFMELLEPAVQSFIAGDPRDTKTSMGPLISAEHRDKVASYLDGTAKIAFQGSAPTGDGFWVPPTVLAPVDTDSRQWHDEIFGPVLCVVPFDTEADAIEMANDTPYGLSGSLWTRDLSRALRVARAWETGNLSVNSHSSVRYWTPFGGFKQSGLGRELGPDAVDAFTETKNVFIAIEENSQ